MAPEFYPILMPLTHRHPFVNTLSKNIINIYQSIRIHAQIGFTIIFRNRLTILKISV